MQKIAVIIPTYKPGEYIEKCFESIECQTILPSQYCVYIALNGPKEDYECFVKSCLEKFKFNYKYFYLSTVGVSNARNALIANSTEDYLVFVDDDDEISPNYLENLLAASTPTTMGIANVINFKGVRNNQFENYIGKSFAKLADQGTSPLIYRKYFSSPWAKMLHRDMIENVHFDTNLTRGEDGLFMANISMNIHSIVKCRKDTIYYVNYRQNSASRKKVDKLKEVKQLGYLITQYVKMLFQKDFSARFVITRILATARKLGKLI